MIDADPITTYLIECENGDVYCGKTKNIDRRMQQHLKEKSPKFFSFKGRRPFYLIYVFEGDFEKQIKRAGVKFIVELFQTYNKDYNPHYIKYGGLHHD
jgi:predicted GIY-YIG superfamily endonuclease